MKRYSDIIKLKLISKRIKEKSKSGNKIDNKVAEIMRKRYK